MGLFITLTFDCRDRGTYHRALSVEWVGRAEQRDRHWQTSAAAADDDDDDDYDDNMTPQRESREEGASGGINTQSHILLCSGAVLTDCRL